MRYLRVHVLRLSQLFVFEVNVIPGIYILSYWRTNTTIRTYTQTYRQTYKQPSKSSYPSSGSTNPRSSFHPPSPSRPSFFAAFRPLFLSSVGGVKEVPPRSFLSSHLSSVAGISYRLWIPRGGHYVNVGRQVFERSSLSYGISIMGQFHSG